MTPATSTTNEMLPHQQHIIEERAELLTKATKLNQFIGDNPLFDAIAPDEQERMKQQNDIMWQYVEILGKRIAAF